jgi:excisionase family DNA binding protein
MVDEGDIDVGDDALELLTIDEIATRLRVSPVTVKRLIAKGDLESVKIGSSRRVAPQDLADFIRRLRTRVSPEEATTLRVTCPFGRTLGSR